jgi:hypothetical protein
VLGFEHPPPDPRGVVSFDGSRRVKVLWAIEDGYAGRVRVTGRRLHGGGPILFIPRPGVRRRRLGLRASGDGWTYAPTAMVIARPGCYALRVASTQGRQTLVFRAVAA